MTDTDDLTEPTIGELLRLHRWEYGRKHTEQLRVGSDCVDEIW